jgi:hypothetical protein
MVTRRQLLMAWGVIGATMLLPSANSWAPPAKPMATLATPAPLAPLAPPPLDPNSIREWPCPLTPVLVNVWRGDQSMKALRGGSFPTQPASAIGLRFKAPWPAALEITVNGVEVRQVPSGDGLRQPRLDAAHLGWYYVDKVSGVAPGVPLPTWLVRVVPPIGLRQSAVQVDVRQRTTRRTLSRRCTPNEETDASAFRQSHAKTKRTSPLRVEATRTTRHPRLWDYTPQQRQELADAIESFLTEAVFQVHHTLDHDTLVVPDHRRYLSQLENYLWVNGLGAKYVPLPFWDPTSESIPPEFRKVVRGRAPLEDFQPNVKLPATMRSPGLCDIATVPDLWSAMRDWHDSVHAGVGGAMRTIGLEAPAALIFWPWHAYVDNIYLDWELCSKTIRQPRHRPTHSNLHDRAGLPVSGGPG